MADAPLLTWCQGKLQGPTGPLGLEQQGLTGGAADALDKVGNGLLTAAQGHGIDADNPISGPQADAGGGLARHHPTDQHPRRGRYARRNPHHQPLAQQHGIGQQQVGDDAGGNHQGPLVQRAVAQQVGIIGGIGAVVVFIGKGDEAPQGNGPQGKQHPLDALLQQHGPETDGKATDADALPGGSQEMARLMHDDQAGQDRQRGENTHAAHQELGHSGGCGAPNRTVGPAHQPAGFEPALSQSGLLRRSTPPM